MTLVECRTLTLNFAAEFGENYILNSQTTLLTSLINERFKDFTRRARCLYDDRIALTMVSGTDAYSIRGNAFTREMVQIEKVYIENREITQINPNEASGIYPTYTDVAVTGKPEYWFLQPPHDLVLLKRPDAVYTGSYVSGWFQEPTLSSDSDSPIMPSEFHRDACRYTALALVEPGSLDASKRDAYRLMEARTEHTIARARIDSQRLRFNVGRRRPSGRGSFVKL